MGIGYVRSKKVLKKECEECGTFWDDEQLFHDKHQYGEDNCPFCHKPWEATKIRKLPKLKLKGGVERAALMKKLYKLQERVGELDGESFKRENTTLVNASVNVFQGAKEHHENDNEIRARHLFDLKRLAEIRVERSTVMSSIAAIEDALRRDVPQIPEPEGIRLPNGQMDWDAAYANMKAYRDSLS